MNRGRAWRRVRRAVLDRDGWRCMDCGRAGRLQVHHVDHNPRNNDPDNLRTLCRDCHLDAHRRPETPAVRAWRELLASMR